ncbi:hypothetical protein D3C72_1946820 [compost metagenome]
MHVSVEPIFVAETSEKFTQDEFRAHIPDDALYGNAGNDRAALRDQLTAARESGGDSARVAVLLDDGRSFILEGSWAAIRRAAPDRATVRAWRDAGAIEFPLWDFAVTGGLHRIRWVPIDHVPVVVQMEYESRGVMSHGGGS